MNYRHIYHAGNFADVLKHAVLARLVGYLCQKPKPFRVIDTHAGLGLYDLSADEAQRTGEWRDGIGRLLGADLPAEAAALLAPYLDAVAAFNAPGDMTAYPGSPVLLRQLLRPVDRLSAIELHPDDHAVLADRFAGDHQVRVTRLNGWLALKGHLPPKERRGLVLVDPPFEEPGEYTRLADGLALGHRRFAGGTFCLWYPKKYGAPITAFHMALAATKIPSILCVEMDVRRGETGLEGSGLIIVNPPYTLEAELAVLLPPLTRILAQDDSASHAVFWLAREA
ncbi:23S rRNA (adenine(2030)-N(6))-methyltransferase RlmJ [Acuticoccus sp. MNP-M23]|uniref:23S rRNA (adenine(2030)-N(6))-methyltransferase RlmJ n=1 Tax=Acuticoccus sp. MNP-M23 TaxID=3072793 RepID=UPI0028166A21|nr:23S rRNA (adenine(2030)-N(6))-methyltransferase RlmJ [Acuticoccus sp. MNP-M23]WMS42608.1 23S rRNA (adenine(2030)-N(6))-methyltransferase RlmJ [Acuticoccus sp. MNP-M23]